jgi:hypothetical protein
MSVPVSRCRILKVMAGLAALGAGVGAITGVVSIALLVAVRLGIGALADASVALPWIALVGATIGLVVFPLAAWVLLRRVGIGSALLAIGLSVIAGSLIGEWVHPLNPYSREIPGLFRGALSGLVIAVVSLRFTLGRVRHLDQAG